MCKIFVILCNIKHFNHFFLTSHNKPSWKLYPQQEANMVPKLTFSGNPTGSKKTNKFS